MADQQFDILIKFGMDPTQARAAVTEMKKVEAASKQSGFETTKAAEKSTKAFGETNRAVAVLSSRLGPLGQALRHVFNPALLGAALLGMAVRQVWNSFQTFLQGLRESAKNAARSIGDITGAMRELAIERAKADTAFKNSMQAFERQSNRKIELIKLEQETLTEILTARESAEMAAAQTPEARAEIKQRYDAARGRVAAQATEAEIAAKKQELDAKEAIALGRVAEGTQLSGGRTPERVALDLQNLPKQLSDLDASIAAQEEVIKKLEVITTPAGMLPYWNDPENFEAQLEAYKGAKVTRDALKAERDRVEGREEPLTQAATAFAAGDALMAEVDVDRESVAAMESDFTTRSRTGWQAAAIRAGDGTAAGLVADAAAGADAILGGGKATAEQAAAINKLAQLLGLQTQNQTTVLQVLGRMNDSEKAFENSLRVIKNQQ